MDTIEQVQNTENIHHTDSTLLVDLYMLAFAYRKIMNVPLPMHISVPYVNVAANIPALLSCKSRY